MSGDIVLGIRLKYDGKDVTGGVTVSREQFKQLASEAKKAGDATAGSFTTAAKGVRSVSEQLDFAKRAVVSYFSVTQAANAAQWILSQASAMQMLEARLKVSTASEVEYGRARAGVIEISNRWGVSLEQTAGTVARLNPVIAQLGGNTAITLRMVDGLSASLRLSGATTAETNAVLMQFAQAMSSGRVGGDEFRSMMESAEPLMRAVAKELGKTSGELRQMAEDGKLTSSVFGNALLPAIDKLKAQAEQIPLGLSQAWQVLENNLSRDFGREFGGQAGIASRAVKGLAENTTELAAGLHAAGDAAAAAFKIGATAAAGAGGAWLAKEAQQGWSSVSAWNAMRLARMADAEAAVAAAATKAAAAATALPPLLAEKTLLDQMMVFGPQRARIEREIAAAKAAGTLATQELAAAETRLAAARHASNLATRAGTVATGAASAAVTALGGPLGIALTLLTAGATAWALWGGESENALTRAKKKLAEINKEKRFGPGDAGDLKAEIAVLEADRKKYTDRLVYQKGVGRREVRRIDAEIAERRKTIADLEQAGADPATPGSAPGPGRLSAASEWTKLTESLQWREKLLDKHGKDSVALANSYNDRLADALKGKAGPDKLAAIRAEYRAASRAQAEAQKQELDALPEAKEGKAKAEALADARVHTMQAASKRVLEILQHEHEQYRLASEDFIRSSAAVKGNVIGVEIDALQEKIRAATKESERIPLRAKIQELRADLAAIPGEISAGLEDADAKQRELIARLAVDAGRTLDPLARAGAEFAEKWGEKMQKAAINGWDGVIAAGRAAWDSAAAKAMFESARSRFEGVTKGAEASIENIRLAAAGGTLSAVDALLGTEAVRSRAAAQLATIHGELARIAAGIEDPAVQAALADLTTKFQEAQVAVLEAATGWQAGARAAVADYDRDVANSAASTRRAYADGFRRAEDAVVQFARTGKLNLRDFANYAISEFYRISIAQPLVSKLAGFANGWFASSSTGPSAAAGGGSWLPSLDSSGLSLGTSVAGLSGARAGGGPVVPRGFYRVNENDPELLTIDGADYLMMGGRPGHVTPPGRGAAGAAAAATPSVAPVTLHYSPTIQIDARGAAVGVGPMIDGIVHNALQRNRAELMAELNNGGALAVATGRRRG